MNLFKILLRQKLVVTVFLVGVLYISFFVYQKLIQKDLSSSALNRVNISEKENSETTLPVRLKIPKLNIDANVEYVGLAPDGSVDVPKGPDNVAWFNLGARPGEVGSAVIDGHSGYKNNKPAVFDNLDKLKKGDKIYVENKKGETITFVVREFKTYKQKTNPSEVFGASDGLAHLNLVTCSGAWNAVDETHSSRLVVFTDKEI